MLYLDVGANMGESVILTLPDGRTVRVVLAKHTGRGRVRLGFSAPLDVKIHRSELLERMRRQQGEDRGPAGKHGPVSGQDAPGA